MTTKSTAGHTPGEWSFKIYATDDDPEKLRKLGLEPVQCLSNDGQRYIMASNKRIALVDCQTPFKRGMGYKTACAERDANAMLIAAAPETAAERDRLRESNASLIEAAELLLRQYDSSGDFTMGGNLTNEPFLKFRAALARHAKAEGRS